MLTISFQSSAYADLPCSKLYGNGKMSVVTHEILRLEMAAGGRVTVSTISLKGLILCSVFRYPRTEPWVK